jgi:microcystin degradation protein MlrC
MGQMKLFMATLLTETNTFSPIPTGRRAYFEESTFYRNDASRHPADGGNIAMIVWRRRAERDGHDLVESICAFAQPGAPTTQTAYEELRGMLLDDLRAAMPVDAVLLHLHGAMISERCDDCEGDILARVRALVGPDVPIGVELDLHCHLTEEMRANCDVMIIYKEYPHTDIGARAEEVYDLTTRAQRWEIRPVVALHDCRMVFMWRTPVEPMRGFVARMQALEGREGILSVSFGHGFPWADMAEVGAKFVVVADGDMAKAQALAARLAREIWDMREACGTPHDSIDGAIDVALDAAEGPVVLAEVADNAGGGAPSDGTLVLRRLVERGVSLAAIGCFWDPVAVRFCDDQGVGSRFRLRIGGKGGEVSSAPIDLVVTVRALDPHHSQGGLSGGRVDFGPSAWVTTDGGIDIILTSIRCQVFSPDAFTGLGCTLADKRIVVVKSMQHFYAGFAPVARAVRYIASPGAVGAEFANLPYTKVTRRFWPRVADPFVGG